MSTDWQPHPIAAMAASLIECGVGLDDEPADKLVAAGMLLQARYSVAEIAAYLDTAIVAARTFARTHLQARGERPRPVLRLVEAVDA